MKNWHQMQHISYVHLKSTKHRSMSIALYKIKSQKRQASNALYHRLRTIQYPEEQIVRPTHIISKRIYTEPNTNHLRSPDCNEKKQCIDKLHQFQSTLKKFNHDLNITHRKYQIVQAVSKTLTNMQITSNRFLMTEEDQQKQAFQKQTVEMQKSEEIQRAEKTERANYIMSHIKKPLRISFKLKQLIQNKQSFAKEKINYEQLKIKKKQFKQRRKKFNLYFKEKIET